MSYRQLRIEKDRWGTKFQYLVQGISILSANEIVGNILLLHMPHVRPQEPEAGKPRVGGVKYHVFIFCGHLSQDYPI